MNEGKVRNAKLTWSDLWLLYVGRRPDAGTLDFLLYLFTSMPPARTNPGIFRPIPTSVSLSRSILPFGWSSPVSSSSSFSFFFLLFPLHDPKHERFDRGPSPPDLSPCSPLSPSSPPSLFFHDPPVIFQRAATTTTGNSPDGDGGPTSTDKRFTNTSTAGDISLLNYAG